MTVTLRPPRRADAERVLELVLARDVADLGHPDFNLEHLLADWDLPEVELERDGRLAEDADGTLTGYGLRIDRDLIVTVRPGREGEGIGTALREAGEARAREAGVPVLRQVTAGSNDLARLAIESAGYRQITRHERQQADLAVVAPQADPLPVRPFVQGADDAEVWRLREAAFAGGRDYVPTSFESFCTQGPGRGDFDPSLWLLHEDAEGLAGVALAWRWERDAGYVETLAVAARARGRGLGRRLLASSLDALRAAGARRAYLNVDLANAPATTLCTSVGFEPVWRSERWEKELAS